MKMTVFIASAFLTLSGTSYAAPPGGESHRDIFRSGFVAHRASTAFKMGTGVGRNFAPRPAFAFDRNRHSFHREENRRFFDRDHRFFFQQFFWPVYWYPYGYPYDYSYLDYGPDYQYRDNSSAPVQPQSSEPAAEHPVVVIINTGDSRPKDSSPNTAYINTGNSSTDAVMQDPNEKIGPRADPRTFVPPAFPQPTQPAAKATQITPQARAGAFGNLVLTSWLEDAGKDVIYVQNTETNDVQKITSEPNLDNLTSE